MQLEFPWRDEEAFKRDLLERAEENFEIVLTDNTSNLLTFDPGNRAKPARLRIHRMFLHAGPDTMHALAIWLTRNRARQYAKKIDAFIHNHLHLVRPERERRIRISTVGAFHNLRDLYDDVNREHFNNTVTAPITWGRMPTIKRRRSIRLGSYAPEDHLIRIHPLLDQEFVPSYFVRYIVYHEMLHAFLGVEETPTGRRIAHSAEFRLMERAYPEFDRAITWHDNPRNLARLLHAVPRAS